MDINIEFGCGCYVLVLCFFFFLLLVVLSLFSFLYLFAWSSLYRELLITESLEKLLIRESKSVSRILSHELPFTRALY
jgi:hypothetical protein